MVKRNKLFIIFIIFILVSCTSNVDLAPDTDDAIATEDIPLDPLSELEYFYATPNVKEISPPNFTLYKQEPVLKRGLDWDSIYVFPSAIVFHNELFHMLYFGTKSFENQDLLNSVDYAVSSDGFAWVRALDEPVQFTGQPEYELEYFNISSILQGNDGEWIMYFSGNSSEDAIAGSFIGRATASEIAGSWTIDAEPILLPGNPARWDGGGISNPQVFRTQSGFVMFFNGTNGDPRFYQPTQVGMATSPDGINWTKYDDPDTTRRLNEESDPVFKVAAGSVWDSTSLSMVSVLQTQQGLAMLYFGRLRKDMVTTRNFGFASSADGITWDRYDQNPIFNPEEYMPNFGLGSTTWLYNQGTQFLYIGAFHMSLHFSEIYLFTSE